MNDDDHDANDFWALEPLVGLRIAGRTRHPADWPRRLPGTARRSHRRTAEPVPMSASPRRRLLLPEMEGRCGAALRAPARLRGTARRMPARGGTAHRRAGRGRPGAGGGTRPRLPQPGDGPLGEAPGHRPRHQPHHGRDRDPERPRGRVSSPCSARATSSEMPFAGQSFDLIVTQAAFKNFRQPWRRSRRCTGCCARAGTAVVQDMNNDAPAPPSPSEVRAMNSAVFNALHHPVIFVDAAAAPRLFARPVSSAGRADRLSRRAMRDRRDRPGGPADQVAGDGGSRRDRDYGAA